MRHIVAALVGAVLALTGITFRCYYKIINLERQQLRIEQENKAVLAENEKLVRMNNQTLRLLTDSSWYEQGDVE